ncbi:MAG: tyrosine--tRNA ligase [Armatimonadetes bacterium]|nr:MAG: tyrosine--tRNA ligase [Armatimonadota bacterium]
MTRGLDEVLIPGELKELIERGTPLRHYIGFEISGKVHLGTGLMTMQVVKNLQQAGVKTTVFLADWHTWLNKKLDGSLDTAREMARSYFEEGLKAAAICAGADPDKIEFILGSELYEQLGSNYWATVIKVSKATTLARMTRSTTIMGRKEGELLDAAMLIYPAMQSADIFAMDVNLTHAGTDQRNVHVVARDSAGELGFQKPVALHHHLLQGLLKPPVWPIPKESREETVEAIKMSKSKPDSAVFIHDSPEEIQRKVKNAFAPEGETEFNPILDWIKYLILQTPDSKLTIKREEKFGGDVTYDSYEELEQDYVGKKLHPMDLKTAVAEWLINKLEPARIYFEDPKRKAALEEVEKLTIKR